MSLYLCVFSGDEEVAGADFGSRGDFNACRAHIVRHLEHGRPGSRFPILNLLPDSADAWQPGECAALERELATVLAELAALPPPPLAAGWPSALAASAGWAPRTAAESFIDVDGEPLLRQLRRLARIAAERNEPLLVQ